VLYVDLLAMLFEVLAKVRKEGLMSIESDVENPHEQPDIQQVSRACQ
jgi:chemotaxis protein MotA